MINGMRNNHLHGFLRDRLALQMLPLELSALADVGRSNRGTQDNGRGDILGRRT